MTEKEVVQAIWKDLELDHTYPVPPSNIQQLLIMTIDLIDRHDISETDEFEAVVDELRGEFAKDAEDAEAMHEEETRDLVDEIKNNEAFIKELEEDKATLQDQVDELRDAVKELENKKPDIWDGVDDIEDNTKQLQAMVDSLKDV